MTMGNYYPSLVKPIWKGLFLCIKIEYTVSTVFLKNRLQQQSGGFSCALDADSLNAEDKPEEGAYYVWKKGELKKLLGTDYDFFQDIYNRNDIGHWEKENYVLFSNRKSDCLCCKKRTICYKSAKATGKNAVKF